MSKTFSSYKNFTEEMKDKNFILIISGCEDILKNDSMSFCNLIGQLADKIPGIKIIILTNNQPLRLPIKYSSNVVKVDFLITKFAAQLLKSFDFTTSILHDYDL